MKGGFYGVRAKQLTLVFMSLVCMTVLFWAWEKTQFLTSLLPPQSGFLQLSPDILVGAPVASSIFSKPHTNTKEGISKVTEKGPSYKQDEHYSNAADQMSSVKITPASSRIEMNAKDGYISAGAAKEMVDGQDKQGLGAAVPVDGAKSLKGKPETNEITTPVLRKEVSNVVKEADFSFGKDDSEQEKHDLNVVIQMETANTNSPVSGKDEKNLTRNAENQACNYAQGKWVTDDNWPLYSGFSCKQWLSEMWACRLTQRTDFAYEKLRWKPKNCKMEEFTASKFLRRMQDKTLAFVGDSLGRQQFQSLMCMITGGEERPHVINVGKEYGLVKARGAVRPDGWAYRFPSTNTTILYYWSSSLCDLEPLDISSPATDYAMHLDRPPAFLRNFLHKFDVLVLNTGHHWNRGKLKANRWIMHVGGVPNTNNKIADIAGSKNFTIYSVVNWVNSQLPKYPGLKAFFRSISPRHFFNGDWNTGGTCDNTTPLAGGKEVLQEEPGDPLAAEAVKGTRVQLLDITAISQLRDEGHISRYSIKATPGVQDCLHWCLPGVPDTWNEILFAQL